MKILCISDEETPAYSTFFRKERLDGINLILSCGDLKAEYLSFLVTMGHVPVYYICGNHDDSYAVQPPEGCECIDGRVVEFNGLRILGLGGCMRYKPEGIHQYSENEMARRIRKIHWKLHRGVDIVVTHAPIQGEGDLPNSRTHCGFAAFRTLLEQQKPRYWLHGHVHIGYSASAKRERICGETKIINVCGAYILEIPDPLPKKA